MGFNVLGRSASRAVHMPPAARQRGMMPQVSFVPARTGSQKALTGIGYTVAGLFTANILGNIGHQLAKTNGHFITSLKVKGGNWFLGAYDSIAYGVHESFYTVSRLYDHFNNRKKEN